MTQIELANKFADGNKRLSLLLKSFLTPWRDYSQQACAATVKPRDNALVRTEIAFHTIKVEPEMILRLN